MIVTVSSMMVGQCLFFFRVYAYSSVAQLATVTFPCQSIIWSWVHGAKPILQGVCVHLMKTRKVEIGADDNFCFLLHESLFLWGGPTKWLVLQREFG